VIQASDLILSFRVQDNYHVVFKKIAFIQHCATDIILCSFCYLIDILMKK